MNLKYRIDTTSLHVGEIAIVWLGQAGFMLKDSYNHIVAIDPYLTDYCERIVGFRRVMPKLISPDAVCADVLISTHDHPDHFDDDAMPFLLSGETILLGAYSSIEKARKIGFDDKNMIKIAEGDVVDLDWCKIHAVYADHGDLAPDAIGVVIEIEGIKVYFAGDTAYRPDKIQKIADMKPDIIIPPINGEYGNLDSAEAVKLTIDVKAKLVIPCHFWMFVEHKGDPFKFCTEAEERLNGICEYTIMTQGEILKYHG